MNAVREAQIGYGSDSTSKGAEAAENMSITMAKMRQDMQQTAEAVGSMFGPPVEKTLNVIEKLASGFQTLMSGPLGKFFSLLTGSVGVITAVAGAMLLLAAATIKVAAAAAVWRSSPVYGLREGLKGGAAMTPEIINGRATGQFIAAGGGGAYLGAQGAQIAEKGSWGSRFFYNRGQAAGASMRTAGQWIGGMPWMTSGPGGEASQASRFGGRAIQFGSSMWRQQFEALRYPGVTDEGRTKFLQRYFGGRGPEVQQAMTETNAARATLASKQISHFAYAGAQKMGDTSPETAAHVKSLEADIAALQAHVKTLVANEAALVSSAAKEKADSELESTETKKVVGTMEALREESVLLAKNFAAASLAAGRFALQTTVKAGAGLIGALGGGVSATIMGAMMLPMLIPLVKGLGNKIFGDESKNVQNYSGFGATYQQTAGVTPNTSSAAIVAEARGAPQTRAQALAMNPLTVAAATAPEYKLNEPSLKDMDSDQALALTSTRWDSIKHKPEAIGQVRDDFINRYGPDQAAIMMSQLQMGTVTSTNLGGYYANIRAGKDTGKNIGMVGDIATSRIRQAMLKGGATGAYREQARGVAGMATQVALAPTGIDKDLLNELNKTYGVDLGQGLADIHQRSYYETGNVTEAGVKAMEAKGLETSESFAGKSEAEKLRYLIENSSDEEAAGLRGKFNVPAGLTGDDLTRRLQKTLDTKGEGLYKTSGTLQRRVREQGPAGQMFEDSKAVRSALGSEAQNVGQNVKAINEMLNTMRLAGMSAPEITKAMGKVQSTFGDPSDPNYILAGMISGQAQQDLALKMPTMTRAQGFQAQVQQFQAIESIKPVTDEQYQAQQDAKNNMAQQLTDQENYFKQMLLMQHQYEIQRKRAQDDYHQQRMWQEQAYQLQRSRAEASFNRQRAYAVQDYNRGVRRANFEFNLQRSRAEADFNHQVMQQAKQMATSVYDVYSRVQEQRTSSASWLIANATDQLKRMQEQEANLKKLREEGLSNQAIQTLKLTDPAQAQEAARLVAEMTPQLVARFNKVAGTERVKAAKALVTDPSSLDWEETRRNFRLNEKRSQDDHERQMKIGHDDFFRGLERQQKEFNIQMAQADHDQGVAMDHMQITYNTSMQRAAEDIADAGLEISGNLTDILDKSISTLTGHAKQQAIEVKKSLTTLRSDTNPIAVAHMQELASIYGFEYKIPKGLGRYLALQGNPQGAPGTRGGGHGGLQDDPHGATPRAEGGIIPGWTPGRDTVHAELSGGEAIMRPEWARAVGKETIDQMNHKARHGGYFLGGVLPLTNATSVKQHTTGYSFATWAGDLNYPGRTDYGAPIHAWKAGIARPFDYHADTSYGRGQVIEQANQSELYAHMSKVKTNLAGKQVQAGEVIGYVGDYGNTGNPPTSHLHFEIRGGKINLGDTAAAGTSSGGRKPQVKFWDVFQPIYNKAEHSAWHMTGAHPLNPGDISKVLNRFGRKAWKQLDKKYGVAEAEVGTPLGDATHNLDPHTKYGANAHGVWTALLGAGFSKIQAAGIMGNMMSENSTFDPLLIQGGGRSTSPGASGNGGYGLVQWTPGSKLTPYLHGHAPSVTTEINALRQQLAGRGTSPEGAAGMALANARSVEEAARAFEMKYERHKPPPQPIRVTQAEDVYDKYAAQGAIVKGAQRLVVGERGPEAVIPLNAHGADFMSQLMGADSRRIGLHSTPMGGGVYVYNTKVDHSTNFSGPITVSANNPHELLNQLKSRQRVMALSRPSLTGSAA